MPINNDYLRTFSAILKYSKSSKEVNEMCEESITHSFTIGSGFVRNKEMISEVGFFHIEREDGEFFIRHYNDGNRTINLDEIADLAHKYKIDPKSFISNFAFKVSKHLLNSEIIEEKDNLENKLLKEANL